MARESQPFYAELEDEDLEDLKDRGDGLEDESDEDDEDEEEVEGSESGEDEVDDEEEEEESEEDDEEEEVETPKGKKDYRIPKARFDEVIAQREAERERSQWLEEQLAKLIAKTTAAEEKVNVAPKFDFDAAEEKYLELAFGGEHADALKLRKQIDTAREEAFEAKIKALKDATVEDVDSRSKAIIDAERFDDVRRKSEAKFPFLNAKHSTYNADAVDMINTLMRGHVAAGKSKSEALRLAVAKGAPIFEEAPVVKKVTERRAEQAKKNATAARSQPSRVSGKGAKDIDVNTIDPSTLSEKHYKDLTPKQKAKLRGDF
jgi:hypothetical protein